GQTVLDPFAGCGSTLEAAYRSGRAGWGIELNADYHESCIRRIAALAELKEERPRSRTPLPEVFHADSRQAADLPLPEIDFVITSPPYWDILKRSRGGVKSVLRQRRAA